MSVELRKSTLMTEGNIWKKLLLFALPLMFGNVFQQLYNTVDSIVVGNFVGKEALAGIGTVSPITSMFIGLCSGLSLGACVVISQHFGARDENNVERAVQTTIALTGIISVICTMSALLLLPTLLRFLGTPEDVYDQSYRYLQIYFLGVAGLLFYNMGSGILRAIGDSRRPLYFLIFSTVMNIVLDLLFVAVFHMGVDGAAYATIMAQALSALLVLFVLTKEKQMYRIRWNKLRLDIPTLKQIVRIGLPSGFQMMLTSFSNVFIQSYINHFGSAAMAGWSSYMKIDQLCFMPTESLGMALTTFVGQNLGAGRPDRVKKAVNTTIISGMIVTLIAVIPTMIFARGLVGLFNRDQEVLYYGAMFLRVQLPFYVILCFNQAYSATLRGAGNTKVPMILMSCSFIVLRQIYMFVASHLTTSAIIIIMGYPVGWLSCTLLMTIYYHRTDITKYVVRE